MRRITLLKQFPCWCSVQAFRAPRAGPLNLGCQTLHLPDKCSSFPMNEPCRQIHRATCHARSNSTPSWSLIPNPTTPTIPRIPLTPPKTDCRSNNTTMTHRPLIPKTSSLRNTAAGHCNNAIRLNATKSAWWAALSNRSNRPGHRPGPNRDTCRTRSAPTRH